MRHADDEWPDGRRRHVGGLQDALVRVGVGVRVGVRRVRVVRVRVRVVKVRGACKTPWIAPRCARPKNLAGEILKAAALRPMARP